MVALMTGKMFAIVTQPNKTGTGEPKKENLLLQGNFSEVSFQLSLREV